MSSALNTIRDAAWRAFEADGMPTSRDEEWKYTDLSRITALLGDAWWDVPASETADVAAHAIPELDAYRLVVAAGRFDAAASNLPASVNVTPLATLLQDDPDAATELVLHDPDAPFASGLSALNGARATDGLVIRIPANTRLDRPLYLLHLAAGGAAHTRTYIEIGAHAEVELIEQFSGGEAAGATNCTTRIELAAGAIARHRRLQMEGAKQWHLGRLEIDQAGDSNYQLHAVELGTMLSRVDIVAALSEAGAECSLNGLFVAGSRQHIDHHTRIEHAAPHCKSRELYRSVLDDRAHGVFNGKVVVAERAIKTDSAQSNANLLLSNRAEIDTKPELEIYNDDVKCAHGATVGQLDANQFFYLRSRGLSEEEARQMLTFAFADEVLAGIGNAAVRRHIERAAFAKLPNVADFAEMLG